MGMQRKDILGKERKCEQRLSVKARIGECGDEAIKADGGQTEQLCTPG